MTQTTTNLIFACDTSGPHVALALLRREAEPGEARHIPIAQMAQPMAKGQVEALAPMARDFLANHGVAFADLGALGVGIGPGNFTGLRIAVSFVRGLAMGLDIPAVGVSAFEAAGLNHAFPYNVAVPGPRGQVYVQRLDVTHGEPYVIPVEDLAGLPDPVVHAADVSPADQVGNVAQVAAGKFRLPNLQKPKPLYVKRPDAAPSKIQAPTTVP